MKNSDILLGLPCEIPEDPLGRFISEYTFSLNAFGKQFRNPDASCEDRIIGDFEIIYFFDGRGIVTINNKEYNCVKGDLVFIPPFVKHKILTTPQDPHSNYWFHFDATPFYKQDVLISAFTGNGEYMMNIGVHENLLVLYKILETEMINKKMGCRVFLDTLITQIITLILRMTNMIPKMKSKAERNLAEKRVVDGAIQFFADNITESLTMVETSKYLLVSEAYIYKCFANILGRSPFYMLNLIRIKRTEQLLKTTDLYLKEIAERVGYSSAFYLSTVFKKIYGKSPHKYRQDYIR